MITLSEYRTLMSRNHGEALGVLKNLDAETVSLIGIEWFADQAKEIFAEYNRLMALEINYDND